MLFSAVNLLGLHRALQQHELHCMNDEGGYNRGGGDLFPQITSPAMKRWAPVCRETEVITKMTSSAGFSPD